MCMYNNIYNSLMNNLIHYTTNIITERKKYYNFRKVLFYFIFRISFVELIFLEIILINYSSDDNENPII